MNLDNKILLKKYITLFRKENEQFLISFNKLKSTPANYKSRNQYFIQVKQSKLVHEVRENNLKRFKMMKLAIKSQMKEDKKAKREKQLEQEDTE